MKNERILSHKLSQKLTAAEIENVSASGTSVATTATTFGRQGGSDVAMDVNVDF